MKKKLLTFALAAAMTVFTGMTAFAGQWVQNTTGWWWQEADGSYPTSQWKWIDGNQDGVYECYAFDSNGYIYTDQETPDGYTVNKDGAWVVNGSVQQKFEKDMSGTNTGETLVVYYSATGHTRNVAEKIANVTGGDLFEIRPAEPYTAADLDWTNNRSRVTREHNDESLRNVSLVSTAVDGWEKYDTVYIGYPIWWGIAAWPTDSFVKANDFTGKTVIPFCTAASSGIGQSGKRLADLAETGNWLSGTRFNSGASDTDVAKWVESLGLGK